ncbi:Protein of unknown function [Alteromonadaceae bacterium Bs31]|nr:Protein of unknown function [Alteromonadaceae bacterium Bs31]
MNYLAIASILVLLSACSGGVKPVNCNTNDWRELGQETALRGEAVRTLDKYKAQCATVGKNQQKLFLAGYKQGLKVFCSYEMGYKFGKENLVDQKICPSEMRSEFEKGYRKGAAEYADMKALIKDIDKEAERQRNASQDSLESQRQRSGR